MQCNPALAKKLVIEQKYNLFFELLSVKNANHLHLRAHTVSFIKSYFSYPSPFWKSIEDFYQARCDAEVLKYNNQPGDFFLSGLRIKCPEISDYNNLVEKGALDCKNKHFMFFRPDCLIYIQEIEEILSTIK